MNNTIKKFLSIFLSFIFILNVSIPVFAAEPSKSISKGESGKLNYIKIEYSEKDINVITIIGGGYRFTNVTNTTEQTSQLYISEYNENYIIQKNSRNLTNINSLANLNDIVSSDRSTGVVSTTQKISDLSNIESRAGIIHRTSLEAIHSFMRHYSDGKYELQFMGNYHSTYSTHPNVNTYSYSFAESIDSINDCMWDIYFSVYGYMDYVSTIVQFANVIQTLVEDGNRGELLIDLANEAVRLIPEIAGSGFLATLSMATNLVMLGLSVGDAKLFYNYVVTYSI